MKLKEEQQRLKDLLKDTITLLCKNGVQYKDEISVEALIGITTDHEKVLLVNIKETIQLKTHNRNDDQKEGESGESDFEQVNTTKTRIIKSAKKRPHSVNDVSDETVHKQQKFCPSISNVVSGDAVNMPPVKVKAEKEEDTDDLVFVKEEIRNSFPAVNTSRQVVAPIGSVSLAGGSFSGAGPPTTLQSPLDGSSVQSPGSAQSWNNPIRRMPYTPPVYPCTLCHRTFKHKNSLVDHQRGTHGIGEPFECPDCGERFQSRGACYRHTNVITCPKLNSKSTSEQDRNSTVKVDVGSTISGYTTNSADGDEFMLLDESGKDGEIADVELVNGDVQQGDVHSKDDIVIPGPDDVHSKDDVVTHGKDARDSPGVGFEDYIACGQGLTMEDFVIYKNVEKDFESSGSGSHDDGVAENLDRELMKRSLEGVDGFTEAEEDAA